MEQAQAQAVTSNKEKYLKRLKDKFPDKDFADEEALYGQINDDYDDYDKQLGGYKEREKSITDLFESNPASAAFFADWKMKGGDAIALFVQRYGKDLVSKLDTQEGQEELAAANKEYSDRVTENEKYEKEYQTNIAETIDNITKMQEEEKLSDDDVDKAMAFLIGIMRDGIVGKFAPESIKMALKAINHDADVVEADREAEVRGKNAKIEEKLRKSARGDGTANLDGKNGGQGTPRERPELGALDLFGSGVQNIWERGGEKRIAQKQ